MLTFLWVDFCHVLLWAGHLALSFFFFTLLPLVLLLRLPAAWTQSLSVYWREWAALLAFTAVASVFYLRYRSLRYSSERWSLRWKEVWRARQNAWSLSTRKQVLGKDHGVSAYLSRVRFDWVKALTLSARGPWGQDVWTSFVLAQLFFLLLLPSRIEVLKTFWTGSSVPGTVHFSEVRVDFPQYTEQESHHWGDEPSPVHLNFLKGSGLHFLFVFSAPHQPQLRLAYRKLHFAVAPEEKGLVGRYKGALQLTESGPVRLDWLRWGRLWESGPALFSTQLQADQIPGVDVEYLSENETLKEGEPLSMRLSALDDFGLRTLHLRITQAAHTGEELIKHFAQPLKHHEELFQWETTGAPLEDGEFTVQVVVRDACDEERRPNEGVSTERKYKFITAESLYQQLRTTLEAWIQLTAEERERVRVETSESVSLSAYAERGTVLSESLTPRAATGKNPQTPQNPMISSLLNHWSYLKQLTENPLRRDHAERELRSFQALLEALALKAEENRMDQRAAELWDAFSQVKDAHISETDLSERDRKRFREHFRKKFQEWSQGVAPFRAEDEALRQWQEGQHLDQDTESLGELSSGQMAQRLEAMEKTLGEGMSLAEQALSRRDQERMRQFRERLDQALEGIDALIEREMAIRDGTLNAPQKSAAYWEALKQSQQQLREEAEQLKDLVTDEMAGQPSFQLVWRSMLSQATRYMEEAGTHLGKKEVAGSLQQEEKAIEALSRSSQTIAFMMQQASSQAQFSRGGGFRNEPFQKRSLTGPYEGPREYRGALQKRMLEERRSPLRPEDRRQFFQRLVK